MTTLPDHITEDGIRQNLIRASQGHGMDMAYHYARFLKECGWVDDRCVITDEGRKALSETGAGR